MTHHLKEEIKVAKLNLLTAVPAHRAIPISFEGSMANTKLPCEMLFVGSTMIMEPSGIGPEIQSIEDDPTNLVAKAFELGLVCKVGTQLSWELDF
jgi:hypothetical protein